MSWLCSSVAAALARSLAGAWNALRCNALQQRPPAPGIVRSTRYLPWTRPALDSPSRIGEIALVAMPRPPSPAPTAREACSHAAHARWPNTRSTLARSLACLLACLPAAAAAAASSSRSSVRTLLYLSQHFALNAIQAFILFVTANRFSTVPWSTRAPTLPRFRDHLAL